MFTFLCCCLLFFFFFNDPATTEIYTLSLHDALPISPLVRVERGERRRPADVSDPAVSRGQSPGHVPNGRVDRKSTRLNSSHEWISYAVFCLKKKKKKKNNK